jgi:nucleoside phosphorylase
MKPPRTPAWTYASAVTSELGDLPGAPVGIGLCDALLGTSALIQSQRPEFLVFVGTAGALPGSGLPIGGVIQVDTVRLGDAALALGLGYSPRHPEPLRANTLPDLPAVDVVANLAITTDPDLAQRYAAASKVEHMEAYGFALACTRANVPWACVLAITNAVGPDAHAQWRAHRAACEAAARAAARRSTAARS